MNSGWMYGWMDENEWMKMNEWIKLNDYELMEISEWMNEWIN